MEMKTEKFQVFDRFLCVIDRAFALQWIDGAPRLANHTRMIVAHPGYVLIGARRRARNRLDVEGYKHRFHAGLLEFFDDLGFGLPRPSAVPVLRQRFHVGPLGFNPRLRVRITM